MDKTLIVILTKNRQKLLDQTVKSLFQNTPRELFDLMIIDDGSDDISNLLAYNTNGLLAHLILTNTGSLGFNKNMGAEWARFLGYKYVYQSDNDMYFLPGWLEECQQVIKIYDPPIKIVGPYCHPFLQANADIPGELHVPKIKSGIISVDAINGNSMFMRTEDWIKYKMQETNGIMASEDWEMSQRIRNDGGLCVKFKENMVLHCGITNSKREPATGADLMIEELSQAKVKHKLNIYYE